MAKLKVSLGIRFAGCTHTDVLDIDDDDLNDCETEEQREDLINEYAMEWAWNYIDISSELIE